MNITWDKSSDGYQHLLPDDLDHGIWPFWKLLALLRTFELWVLEFIHFTWIFVVTKFIRRFNIFYHVTLTLEFEILLIIIDFSNNCWTASAWALIFHMNILWDIPIILTRWPLPWSLTYFLKTFSLAYNFWTVSTRFYTFHMNISNGKALIPWVPTFFFSVTLTLVSY